MWFPTTLTTDPKFISGTDFRLQSGSPAIDGGRSLLSIGISADFAGATRPQGCCYDIGAYEYATRSGTSQPSSLAGILAVTVDSTYDRIFNSFDYRRRHQ